jgi:hypothetical protein
MIIGNYKTSIWLLSKKNSMGEKNSRAKKLWGRTNSSTAKHLSYIKMATFTLSSKYKEIR